MHRFSSRDISDVISNVANQLLRNLGEDYHKNSGTYSTSIDNGSVSLINIRDLHDGSVIIYSRDKEHKGFIREMVEKSLKDIGLEKYHRGENSHRIYYYLYPDDIRQVFSPEEYESLLKIWEKDKGVSKC